MEKDIINTILQFLSFFAISRFSLKYGAFSRLRLNNLNVENQHYFDYTRLFIGVLQKESTISKDHIRKKYNHETFHTVVLGAPILIQKSIGNLLRRLVFSNSWC